VAIFSQEVYEHAVALNEKWRQFWQKVSNTYVVPDGVSWEDINHAAATLRIEL
jgi:hypothetical protein